MDFFRSQPELCPKSISEAVETQVKFRRHWRGACFRRWGGSTPRTTFVYHTEKLTRSKGWRPCELSWSTHHRRQVSTVDVKLSYTASKRMREPVLLFQPAPCCLFFIQTPRASACGGLFQDRATRGNRKQATGHVPLHWGICSSKFRSLYVVGTCRASNRLPQRGGSCLPLFRPSLRPSGRALFRAPRHARACRTFAYLPCDWGASCYRLLRSW